ncbi:site-specific integrase [Sphingomonas sp. NIBR02145]|uniref:site-specific integrase n=1 Tax=Sphingomonas sp. NIBR02145 TaxID=3014784 RepID=UPI0022B55378|nr:site-specific integrase [Sphingomonas sp. NIBR02145]WHU04270.1 tyrosine-type recombinase/integrase [Sphingomonas sp. NIBR02145]
MANLALSLTDRACARTRPEAREYALRDIRQPGLALRVQPCGAKSWIMRTRKDGRSVRQVLGSFPDTDVSTARRIAAALMAGDTPAPAANPAAPLFEVFQAEHERRAGAFYKPEGLRTYQSYVSRRLIPAFGGMRLDAITRQDVVRWFEGYSVTRPGGANRALGILRHLLSCATAWGYLPPDWRNPTTGVRMNRRRIVGTFLSEDEMARFGEILDQREAEKCTASALLRFLTLTGCRVSEAITLEWRDVLTDRLKLRDSKTGPREVILGASAIRFLKKHRIGLPLRARSAHSFVFPLEAGQRYESVRSAWLAIRQQAQLPAKLRIHDLRHSFASHAIMSGETLFCTSRLLGHSRVQMTARYAHLADGALSTASEKLGTLLLAQAGIRSG